MKGTVTRLLAAAATTAALVGAVAGAGASSASTPEPMSLRAVWASFPDYMDPQLSYTAEGWNAMYDTYVPLLTFRHAGGRAGAEVIPGLARKLPKISHGGRTYTLFLRRGLKYSDGTPVRATDFEYAVKRMLRMNSGGYPLYLVIAGAGRYLQAKRGGISGIEANNRSGKIVIHLLHPTGTFANLLAVPFAAPVPPDTPMYDQSASPPPATGPYVITESDPGVGWTYERNPAWGDANGRLMPQLPGGHVDRIDVEVVRNAFSEVRAVQAGEADWMQNPVPPQLVGRLRRLYGGSRFREFEVPSTYYFWMNTTKPPFDDLRVRRAANYAVDPRALAAIYGGQLAPAHQILPPGMPGFGRFNLYPHSMRKARRLIAEADPSDRRITVWGDTESPNEEATEYFAGQLRKIGFHVRLEVVNADFYFSAIGNTRTPNLDAGWSDWFPDYMHPDNWFRPMLLGSSIRRNYNGNFAQIRVPALDAEIEALSRKRLGPAVERRYAKLDRSFMKLAPWVPYGTRILSAFFSRRVDPNGLVLSEVFGADPASIRLK